MKEQEALSCVLNINRLEDLVSQTKSGLNKAEDSRTIKESIKWITSHEVQNLFFAKWSVNYEWQTTGVAGKEDKSISLFLLDFDLKENKRWFLTRDLVLFSDQQIKNKRVVKVCQNKEWLNLKMAIADSLEREVYLAKARGGPRLNNF